MRNRSRESWSSPSRLLNTGSKTGRIRVITGAVGCVKPEKAQNAQVVLGDALGRIADEAHPTASEILEAAGIIKDLAVARRRQCVNGEIPSLGVGLPVASELDPGVASVGFYILAQRGDFERMPIDNDGDRAVLDTGRHVFEPGSRHPPYHFFWYSGGGHVDLRDRHVQQCVADGATDHTRLLALAIEHAEQPRQCSRCQPGDIAQVAIGTAFVRRHYFVVPGTNLPFSMCAGT